MNKTIKNTLITAGASIIVALIGLAGIMIGKQSEQKNIIQVFNQIGVNAENSNEGSREIVEVYQSAIENIENLNSDVNGMSEEIT